MMSEVQMFANPFPGLRPFEMGESRFFFGRDGHSNQLLERLMRTRFAAVVGVSGSGKSSLVRAGLLPIILGGVASAQEREWRVAILRPGAQPVTNLAHALDAAEPSVSPGEVKTDDELGRTEAALNLSNLGLVDYARQAVAPTGENMLIVVDQFEEIFRFLAISDRSDYLDQAAAFVKLLLEASRQREVPIYIVLTMRSDFLGDCDKFWDLPEAINEGQYLIPRLTRDEYRQVITGPIAVQRASVTPRLVNKLLNDVSAISGQLPVLQHALMRTWEAWMREGGGRSSASIDISHYEAIGSMAGALSRQGDEAYAELSDTQRPIAEKIFKGLTERGADSREIRRPSTVGQLSALAGATVEEIVPVIDVFRREGLSFLMPPSFVPLDENSVVDISHESLIRNWQRLKDWVDEEAESRRVYLRIHDTAQLYDESKAALMRDPELSLALNWREHERPTLAWAKRYAPDFDNAMSFLEDSHAAYEHDRQEAERLRVRDMQEAMRRQKRRSVRLLGFIVSLIIVIVITSTTAVYTFRLKAEAERQRSIAEEKAREALDAKKKLEQLTKSIQMQLEMEKAAGRQLKNR